MDKSILRDKFIKIRNNIKNKQEKSDIIIKKIVETEFYKKANVIAVYVSLYCEVDTTKLITKALKDQKTVVVPKIKDRYNMEFYKIESEEELNAINQFGINEPLGEESSMIDKEQIDVMIIPGICFDKSKNRVGFGKGYYDKYLFQNNSFLHILLIC